jgi:dUTP pyrophosphatase
MLKLTATKGEMPSYATTGAAGFDIATPYDVFIPPQSQALVKTGLFLAKPQDKQYKLLLTGPMGDFYVTVIPELQLRARSGLAFKYMVALTNGIGTIDQDYPSDIGVLLINHNNASINFKAGDRIAQGVWSLVVRDLGLGQGESRVSGFGSTGT